MGAPMAAPTATRAPTASAAHGEDQRTACQRRRTAPAIS
jgi:hypothetical protein